MLSQAMFSELSPTNLLLVWIAAALKMLGGL